MNNNAQQTTLSPKRVYCVDEIAEMLSISKNSAYELIRSGVFITVRIGTAIRVSKRSFDEWLDSQQSEEQEVT